MSYEANCGSQQQFAESQEQEPTKFHSDCEARRLCKRLGLVAFISTRLELKLKLKLNFGTLG